MVSVHGASVLGADTEEVDPLEMAGVRHLWDWGSSWHFDEMMSYVEPPAVVETPVYSTFLTQEQIEAALPGFAAMHPLGRNGKPADVVNAMMFLASDDASWITGITMPLTAV